MRRRKKSKKLNLRQVAFTRFMLVVAAFILWIGGISVRLVHLQVTQHADLKAKAISLRQDVRSSKSLRGSILDRRERALAMSVRAQTLYADPTQITDPEAAARALGKALKVDVAALGEQLKEAKDLRRRYLPIARKLDDESVNRVNKMLDTPEVKKAEAPKFAGLYWSDDQRRTYPNQTLAAHIVGFSDAGDVGRAGIEQSQEEILHGAITKRLEERDRLGRVYEEELLVQREQPADVVLTIDTAYQYMVEQALERGVRASEAKSGTAIVILPKTGEILALANYPTFDPGQINAAAPDNMQNRAIQSVYAPGSVFKVVAYGSALEKNLIAPDDTIDSGSGTIEVAKRKFSDPHAVGRVSYSQAMAKSSNVCAIKTALGVGREDFFSMMQRMGFGGKTGIELPAETQGIVRSLSRWNGDSLASMAIGYEVSVTALQMTNAFATIANNGIRNQPRIIKEVRRAGEESKTTTQAQQIQAFTPETARSLRTMLRQVVLTGTGRRAQLDGYTSAGKTGTAWKYNAVTKSIDSSKYISSFIGMAPAENPEIVVGVMMDEPRAGARDGGMVSAPVFREIAQQILQEMKIAPDAPFRPDTLTARKAPVKEPTSLDANPQEKMTADAKPKLVGPQPKSEKQKDARKPPERKAVLPGKLTALRTRKPHPVNDHLAGNIEIET